VRATAAETRWQAFYRSVLTVLILGGILVGFAFYTYRYLTADSRFEDGCLERDAQVIHLDDGSLACDFGFGTEPVIFER